MNVVTTYGQLEAREERYEEKEHTGKSRGQRGRNLTVALAISATAGLVFHSAIIGGMNAQTFADFLTQKRLHLDPDEQVVYHLRRRTSSP